MKAMVDTNVVMDFVLMRKPFYADAQTIMRKAGDEVIQGYISASMVSDVFSPSEFIEYME